MKSLIFRFLIAALVVMSAMVALILHVPIGFYLKKLENAHSPVQLAFASGTLLGGSAIVVVVPASANAPPVMVPGRLSWRVDFGRVLLGELSVELGHTAVLTRPVRVSVGASQLALSEIRMRLPLGLLQGIGAPFNSLKLAGTADVLIQPVKLSTKGFLWDASALTVERGAARLLVSLQRQSADGLATDVGQYLGVAKDLAARPILSTVRTLEGPLKIEGTLSLRDNLLTHDISVGDGTPKVAGDQDWLGTLSGRYAATHKLLVSIANK